MKTLQLVFFLEFSFATRSTCIEKTCNEIDLYRKDLQRSKRNKLREQKITAEKGSWKSCSSVFLCCHRLCNEIQQVSISGFPHWILGSLDSRAIWRPFWKVSNATKVQYCSSSKHLDWISFVWELIFWYYIDILVKLSSSYEVSIMIVAQ